MLPLTQRRASPPPGEAGFADSAGASATNPIPFATLEREHVEVADELREACERVVRGSAFILGEEVAAFEEAWAHEELSLPMSPKLEADEIAVACHACAAAVGDRGSQHGPL